MLIPIKTVFVRCYVLSIIFVLVLCSCTNNSAPSESEAKEKFNSYLSRDQMCRDQLKLVELKKTNGRKSGENEYVMSFSVVINILKNNPSLEYCVTGNNIISWGRDLMAGANKQLQGEILFNKTENGWEIGQIGIEYQ